MTRGETNIFLIPCYLKIRILVKGREWKVRTGYFDAQIDGDCLMMGCSSEYNTSVIHCEPDDAIDRAYPISNLAVLKWCHTDQFPPIVGVTGNLSWLYAQPRVSCWLSIS